MIRLEDRPQNPRPLSLHNAAIASQSSSMLAAEESTSISTCRLGAEAGMEERLRFVACLLDGVTTDVGREFGVCDCGIAVRWSSTKFAGAGMFILPIFDGDLGRRLSI